MRKLLVGVRDVPAQAMIGIPMLFSHAAVACRWFNDMLVDANSVISKHPLDYELVQYGEYHEDRDLFEAGGIPVVIWSGREWDAAQKEMRENAS